ncbi:hypothetical protein GYMLUDRAFT_64577 [Collybiopsis luxurians FD-317 M1]|uniref:Uncharacterized protein n=1 Tax=Collybiopsis luxurians FD-317 M1 TaxID=944289 RepID=A0A0D0BBZ4_9AGAR|nr:hypothetical protein GYMLUDRAFT_64577 [Collybiopsis luxurians FD-317 M1]
MSYLSSVCGCSFKQSQDCISHIKLKKDVVHIQYIEAQSEKLTANFANAVKTSAVATSTISSNHPPMLEAPLVQVNDMDSNDLPSSAAIAIDTDNDNDSASIKSSPAELVKDCKDEINE